MRPLVPVRFLARYALYNEGEVAGVEPDVAARLIAAGRAVAYEPAAVAEHAAAPSKARGKK